MTKFSRWLSSLVPSRRPIRRPESIQSRSRLVLEQLENREVPTADLTAISDFTTPSNKVLLVPLSLNGAAAGTVSYTATSDNAAIRTQVLTGRSLVLNVSGTDSGGQAFTGELRLRLFEDLAPIATGRIVELTNSGFYNGLTFHRIINDFVIQGGDPNGDGTGGSPLPNFSDEFNVGSTFNSPGLLAMANSGDDTNNSQFFITDLGLPLGQEPQFLNFNHTILGQLTSGFDTYQKVITTPTSSANDAPVSKVTINTAAIVDDTTTAVLRVSSNMGFVGAGNISITANDGTGASTAEGVNVNFVPDTNDDRTFLGAVANLSTTVGTAVSFQIPAVDLDGNPTTYTIRDTNFQTPTNVTVSIDQATGRATLTPAAGFIGSIDLIVGVRDQMARSSTNLDARDNFDTQTITLTVTGSIDLDADSDTGPANDDNVTGNATPTLTIISTAGQVITLTINGSQSVVATETSTPGTYTATIPANALTVGPNTITGAAGATQLSSLTINYAPRLTGLYYVPGALGTQQELSFNFLYAETDGRSEVGAVRVDDDAGTINGIAPGAEGYVRALLQSQSRRIIFGRELSPGESAAVTFNGGDRLVFYIIQNSTSLEALARLTVGSTEIPPIFLSLSAGNTDTFNHANVVDDPLRSQALYAFEDITGGGDQDFNDLVFVVRPTGTSLSEGIRIPGVQGRDLAVTFQLQIANRSADAVDKTARDTSPGEVGLFTTDDEAGVIDGLRPGDPGYAQAALRRGQVLFATGAAALTQQMLTLNGGAFLGFYYVPNGTAADVVSRNPNNAADGDVLAFFNYNDANPDAGVSHFRSFSAENASIDPQGLDSPFQFHMMGTLNGGPADFDDISFTMNFNQQ